MPVIGGVLVFALAISLAIHAGRTGRPQFWIYLLIFLPGLGSFAYLLFELIPEWLGTRQGQKAQKTVSRLIDPEKAYKILHDAVETSPTVETMSRLAEECISLSRFDEAADLYDACLQGVHAADPQLLLGLARAQFGLGRFDETKAALDRLRSANPEFQSADGHLLYARALEGAGNLEAAHAEYVALRGYFPGPEASCRLALLLQKMGRDEQARGLFKEIRRSLERAPKHVREMHAEWFSLSGRHAGS
jgi:hypothetical protein